MSSALEQLSSEGDLFACSRCASPSARNLCSGCYKAFYCDEHCQQSDWRNGHVQRCGVNFSDMFGYRERGALTTQAYDKKRLLTPDDKWLKTLMGELGIEFTVEKARWIANWIAAYAEDRAEVQRHVNFLYRTVRPLVKSGSVHMIPSTRDTFSNNKHIRRYLEQHGFVVTLSKTYPHSLTILFIDPNQKESVYSKINVLVVTNNISRKLPYYLVTTGMDQEEYADLPLDDPLRDTNVPDVAYGSLDEMIKNLKKAFSQ